MLVKGTCVSGLWDVYKSFWDARYCELGRFTDGGFVCWM